MEHRVDIFGYFLAKLEEQPGFSFGNYLQKFQKFASMKTNLDRINFVYKDFKEKCPNFPTFKPDVKNDDEAVRKREEGNVFFKSENYVTALECYTISISLSKSESVLALAFANRSAALFRLELYEECLMDIDRALKHGYPDDLKPKLVKRERDCKSQKNKSQWRYYEPVPTIPESEKNPLIECAKNCVKIVHKKQYGRCVVATRDIEVGEILAVEKVNAAVITDQFYTHCHECLELCYNLIPCNSCTKTLYCSESCKERAFENYHRYECQLLLTLDCVLDNPKKLALKLVLMAKNELQSSSDHKLEDNELYRSDRFKEVLNMERHLHKRSPENLLARTLVAAALFHLIKTRSTFLQDGVDQKRFKEILLDVILICSINTVNIDERAHNLICYDCSFIASSIYSFFTIFNHSCCANVLREFHGTTMVMRAWTTIKKGEQCFVNYGPNYKEYDKEFRQNFLATHQFFTCTCQPCQEDWPKPNTYPLLILRLAQTNDVKFVKKELKNLLVKAKKEATCQERSIIYRDALRICFAILGNKRRF